MHYAARALAAPLVLAVLLGVPGSIAYGPRTIAALGDSITQAANTCCRPGNHPAQSWSTGDDGSDGILSLYERLAVLLAPAQVSNHNDAASGAKAADLPAQAAAAVAQRADYVTILIGANDLCTPSASTMTSTASFAGHVREALATLHQGLPRARIFVASIPDIYRLWSVLHTNRKAARIWSAARICQSMLAAGSPEARRRQVASRELAFNRILAETCATYPNCRWDGGAVYRYRFGAGQLSTVDYFHPGPGGQAALAELAWNTFRQRGP